MDKHIEKIVIGLAFVALAALVIANIKQPTASIADLPAADYDNSQVAGPLYLLGNLPWAYQPWVGNSIPQITSGQGSQSGAFSQIPLGSGDCVSGAC